LRQILLKHLLDGIRLFIQQSLKAPNRRFKCAEPISQCWRLERDAWINLCA
jgi:hypothetical protein